MNGARATENNRKSRGSAAIEAAIAMPVFLVVIFSLAYLIRIFFIYNTIQVSLSEVARRIGNMSYFYHVSGLKDYQDMINVAATEAGSTLEEQKNTIMDAFGSFSDTVSGAQDTINSGAVSVDDIQSIIDQAESFDKNMKEASELVQSVIKDPKAELGLFLRIFAQKLSYEVTKGLVCLIAQGDLGLELNKRVKSGVPDAALTLGIKGGINGMDFSQSGIFGDNESLEFIVHYSIRPPAPFNLIPELKLSNRVKIIAWTGGRGSSVRIENSNEVPSAETSVWTKMDQDNRYWDRGLEIEEIHVCKLVKESQDKGLEAFNTSNDYPVIDAYTYNSNNSTAEYYDVFTLNPFLKTYSDRNSAISYEIKKHGKRLLECEAPEYIKDVEVKGIKRIVVFIIPEESPSYAIEAFNKAKNELEKLDVEVRIVMGYGRYSPPVDDEVPAEAS